MLNPSRRLVMLIMFVAVVALVLGLASDVGLVGWTFALLLVVYLGIAGLAQRARRRTESAGRPA
jgi:putative exporter of polyketide antibiotics